MPAPPGLNAGFLVGGQDTVVRRQRLAVPAAGIEIENRTRFRREGGIARKQPAAKPPRPDGVGREPYLTPGIQRDLRNKENGAVQTVLEVLERRLGVYQGC